MPIYSEKVMEHFTNPRNVGEIAGPDGAGEAGNPVCGDVMKVTITVKDNRLEDVKFLTFGCGAAIAVASMVSEMARGKTLEEALSITNRDVARELGGLPGNKMHCSNLGAEALHNAIHDYMYKSGGRVTETASACGCPFCDGPACPDPDSGESACRVTLPLRADPHSGGDGER